MGIVEPVAWDVTLAISSIIWAFVICAKFTESKYWEDEKENCPAAWMLCAVIWDKMAELPEDSGEDESVTARCILPWNEHVAFPTEFDA